MTETPESFAREISRLHQDGRLDEALALAARAAERFTNSPLSHANLGFLRILSGEHAAARSAYERALLLDPSHAEARRGLAVAKAYLGEEVQGDSLSIVPFRGSGRAVELLVPVTLGSGNVVIDGLFDPAVFRVTKLAVELHPHDAGLPAHDVVFNAIGDVDSSAAALAAASDLLARTHAPVLNQPARVSRTGRCEQAERLRRIDGVVTPGIRRIRRSQLSELVPPVLVRAPGYHAGKHFERLDEPGDRERAAQTLPEGDLFAIEFLDTRDAEGLYTKYRVVAVGGRLFPVHLAISHQWKVHYFSAEMASSSAYREREARFLAAPEASVGRSAWERLEGIIRDVGLDYAGIDFTLDRAGNVVVFECNATMAVRYPPDEPMWEYRRPAVDAIMEAMRAMLTRYSST